MKKMKSITLKLENDLSDEITQVDIVKWPDGDVEVSIIFDDKSYLVLNQDDVVEIYQSLKEVIE